MSKPTLVICTSDVLLRALKRRMNGVRGERFGLFDGWSAQAGDASVTAVLCERSEEMAYAAVRQMIPLVEPGMILYLSEAVAVAETIGGGDLVWALSVRRCYCPVVVTDNMFPDYAPGQGRGRESGDELVFANDKIRRHVLEAPVLGVDSLLLETADRELFPGPNSRSVQPDFSPRPFGSARVQNWEGRGAEFLATRFGVGVISEGAYGAIEAAGDAGACPLLPVGLITAGRSGSVEADYRENKRRHLDAAAEMLESLIARSAGQL